MQQGYGRTRYRRQTTRVNKPQLSEYKTDTEQYGILAKEKAARKFPDREREPKAQAKVKKPFLTASIRFSRLPKTKKKATEERDGREQAAQSKTDLQKTDKPNETPK